MRLYCILERSQWLVVFNGFLIVAQAEQANQPMSDTQNITRYIDALPVIAMVFHGHV